MNLCSVHIYKSHEITDITTPITLSYRRWNRRCVNTAVSSTLLEKDYNMTARVKARVNNYVDYNKKKIYFL